MPILLSSSRGSCTFIIGGSRVHARMCAPLHAAQLRTHLKIRSLHAFRHPECQRQSNGAVLIELCRHFAEEEGAATSSC